MKASQDIRYGQTAVYGQYSSWPGYLGSVSHNPDLRIKVWVGPLLGNYDLSEFGAFLIDETILGVSPSIKIEEISIPGRHGAFLQGTKLGDRVFELVLGIDPNRDIELDYHERVHRFLSIRDRLSKVLDEIRDGSTLVFAEEPERSYSIFWRDLSSIQEYLDSGVLTIPLVAKPQVLGKESITVAIPANTPYTIEYSGTRITSPKITLYSKDSVAMYFNNIETELRPIDRADLTEYIGTTLDGTTFELYSTYTEGQVPDLDRLKGLFPTLRPGTNTILSNVDLVLTYREVWDE